jgi:hypothetical protein
MGWKIVGPFRTTKDCTPNWNLPKYSFVQTKYLAQMVQSKVHNSDTGGQSSSPGRKLFYFLTMISLGAPV